MEFSFLMSKPFMGIYGSKGMCLDDVHDRVEITKQLALCCCLLSKAMWPPLLPMLSFLHLVQWLKIA